MPSICPGNPVEFYPYYAEPSSITAEALRTEVEALIGQTSEPLSDEVDEALTNAVGDLCVFFPV